MKTLERIMLIDDDQLDRAYHALLLQRLGAAKEVLAMDSAEDALVHLQSGTAAPVDLIFLDLNMPRMDGFDFVNAYAAIKTDPAPPIVMLSASPLPEDRERACQHPEIASYISKPLTTDALREVVGRIFDKR